MAEIRVVVVYSELLESVSVDGMKLEEISSIQNKPVEDWFEPSGGRDGWEGLIVEIYKKIGEDKAKLNFEFLGPKEIKHRFEECIQERGCGSSVDGLPEEDIVRRNIEEARRAEHRGLYKKAFDCYLNAAKMGKDVEAQTMVAHYYYDFYHGEERGVTAINDEREDAIAEAINYYEMAAKQGSVEAQYRLYEIFSEGDGVKENQEEAFRWVQMAAEQGDKAGMVDLGYCYIDGKGTGKDEEKGFRWIGKSAEQGYADAQCDLGYCYSNGIGTGKNEEKAFEWYRKSAEQGNMTGQYYLGYCYKNGIGTEKDEEKAFEWYRKSAEQGYADAQYDLGLCYVNGIGTEKDEEKSFEWIKKSAEEGNARAQYNLGFCYINGIGTEKDEEKGFKWTTKSAEQGYADAQDDLGLCYVNGIGTEKDEEKGFEWCKKSAEQGNANAQLRLGTYYEAGKGTEKDEEKAFEWKKKSAEQGNAMAQCALGLHYLRAGMNKVRAKYADQGFCSEKYIESEENLKKGFEWFEKSLEEGCADAQYWLGICYDGGIGCERNKMEAIEYYRKAIDIGEENYFDTSSIETAQKALLGILVDQACQSFYQTHQRTTSRSNEGKSFMSVHKITEKTYLWHDDTAFGGCKEGFAITEKGIYYKNLLEKLGFLSYQRLVQCNQVTYAKKNPTTINIGSVRIPYMIGHITEDNMEELKNLIIEIRDYARDVYMK